MLKMDTLKGLRVGDIVIAHITKSGRIVDSYRGTIFGFTKTGRVKVKTIDGIKIHAYHNIKLDRL